MPLGGVHNGACVRRILFEGFQLDTIDTGEATLRVRHGGSGPPLLLLHGHPQTPFMWRAVAPRPAADFTVVAPDLRGYGASSKPTTMPDHEPYSKRAMARDMVTLMRHLGFERFSLAGHDRGGRVAYRLALDHPERVERIAVLDVLPTYGHIRRADMQFGLGYWHWFFLAQPFDEPERVIGADPAGFFTRTWPRRDDGKPTPPRTSHRRCSTTTSSTTSHLAQYTHLRGLSRRGDVNYALDEADKTAGRRITRPLLALWAARCPACTTC